MISLPNYRVTEDDLPDMDKKTKHALEPLLSGLNRTLTAIVTVLNSLPFPEKRISSITTDGTGHATVSLKLDGSPAQEVWLSAIAPAPVAVFSMVPTPIRSGAQLDFYGLAASTTYKFTVRYI